MKNVLYVLLGVMAGFVLAGVLVFVSRAPEGSADRIGACAYFSPDHCACDRRSAASGGVFLCGRRARAECDRCRRRPALPDANTDSLNLAALLEDGEQLDIPYTRRKRADTKLLTCPPLTPRPQPQFRPHQYQYRHIGGTRFSSRHWPGYSAKNH